MIRFRIIVCAVTLVLLAGTNPRAGAVDPAGIGDEWPQWLGPNRNSISASTIRLAKDWTLTPLKKLWSNPVPSDLDGGCGGPAVAGGRALVYVNWKAESDSGGADAQPRATADDLVLCFDATSGQKQWEARFPSVYVQWECSSTPTIVGERCFVQGAGRLYCLEMKTGKTVFTVDTTAKKSSSSPAVRDGRVYVISGALLCFAADSGKLLWKQEEIEHNHSSPVFWTSAGKTCLICNSGANDLACVRAEDGAMLWQTTPGGAHSTPIVCGDYVVVQSHPEPLPGTQTTAEKGALVAYKLSVDKAEKLWEIAHKDRGASPVIYDGYVYAISGGHGSATEALRIKLDSGALVYRKKTKFQIECSNPLVLDSKLLFYGDGLMLGLTGTDQFRVLTSQKVWAERCTSPVVAYGRLYVRGQGNVSCFELPVKSADTKGAGQ